MVPEEEVRKVIGEVLVPGVKRSVTQLNILQRIEVTDEMVRVTLASAGLRQVLKTG